MFLFSRLTLELQICILLTQSYHWPRESHAQQDQVDCHDDPKQGENEGHNNRQECRAGNIGESSFCQADEAVVFRGSRQTYDYAKDDEHGSDPKGPPCGSLLNGHISCCGNLPQE